MTSDAVHAGVGRNTDEQRIAFRHLRALAAAARFRVVPDAEGWPMLPGRYGQVEWYCDGVDCHACPLPGRFALAVWTDHRLIPGRLRQLPGLIPHQIGEAEARFVFCQKERTMADKRWHPVGSSGNFKKWTEKGQAVEGLWEGTTPGKFGDLGIVKQADGTKVTFPLHTVLADRLQRIREGAEILIEYLGKETSKGGRTFKNFEVMVGNVEDILPEAVEPEGETPF